MTVQDAKERKAELKKDIHDAIEAFEEDTGLAVEDVNVHRLAEKVDGKPVGVRVEVEVQL